MLDRIRGYFEYEKTVLAECSDEINKYNRKMLMMLLVLSFVCYIGLFALSFINRSYKDLWAVYGVTIVYIAICWCFLWRLKDMPVKVMNYGMYTIMVLLCAYSSAFISQTHIGSRVLVFVLLFPIVFIDNSLRVNAAELIYGLVYAALMIEFKRGDVLVDEVVNIGFYTTIGITVGQFVRMINLHWFMEARTNEMEKYYDRLTGLPNEIMLKKMLDSRETQPYAMAVLEIENLNRISAKFAGEVPVEDLKSLGECLRDKETVHRMRFFILGGREIVAIIDNSTKSPAFSRLSRVQTALNKIGDGFCGGNGIEFSIGGAYWRNGMKDTSENAYKALDYAKNNGKNRIIIYDEYAEQIEKKKKA